MLLVARRQPGDEGTNAATTLIGTDEERAQATSSDATTGSTTSTGDPATWSITEAATITYLGQHDAFSGGNPTRCDRRRPARDRRRRGHRDPVVLHRDGGLMPVLFDSTAQGTTLVLGGSASGSKTITHRVSTFARDRVVAYVWVLWTGAVDVSGATFSATFGGESMTLIGSRTWDSTRAKFMCFKLEDAPRGSQAVVVSFASMPTELITRNLRHLRNLFRCRGRRRRGNRRWVEHHRQHG